MTHAEIEEIVKGINGSEKWSIRSIGVATLIGWSVMIGVVYGQVQSNSESLKDNEDDVKQIAIIQRDIQHMSKEVDDLKHEFHTYRETMILKNQEIIDAINSIHKP